MFALVRGLAPPYQHVFKVLIGKGFLSPSSWVQGLISIHRYLIWIGSDQEKVGSNLNSRIVNISKSYLLIRHSVLQSLA